MFNPLELHENIVGLCRNTIKLEDCRSEVKEFALLMEAKLRDNDHKGGWQNDRPDDLLLRAYDELAELKEALDRYMLAGNRIKRLEAVVFEAVDVSNYMMMIADVVTNNTMEGTI